MERTNILLLRQEWNFSRLKNHFNAFCNEAQLSRCSHRSGQRFEHGPQVNVRDFSRTADRKRE